MRIINRWFCITCSFCLFYCTFSATTWASKPNIVFILSDDLSWGDLGCYGQQKIKTPHIDRIAREGMRFTNAYAGNSVCAPSRSCLMQGLHPGHARVRGNSYKSYRHSLQAEDVTVAEILKKGGYATGLFGKWGLGLSSQPGIPNRKGFDQFYGYLNQRKAHNFYPPFLWDNQRRVQFPQHKNFQYKEQSTYDEQGAVIPVGMNDPTSKVYSFDRYCEKSLQFVRDHQQQPFFLYLAYTPPHGQLIVPHLGIYSQKEWAIGHQEWASIITRMDNEVGKLLALLEELKLDDNTIIFFASDNGYSADAYNRDKSVQTLADFFENRPPVRGKKGNSYDGAFRVPAMVRWPGKIQPGQVSDHIWAFWDFLPTAAELAGVQFDNPTDGISIIPTLLGKNKEQQQHEFLYWEFNKNQAVRMGDWFAHRRNGGDVELYHLVNDPHQKNNVAKQQAKIVERALKIMLKEHTPSEVWPSPGESTQHYNRRLKTSGIDGYPANIDG